MTREQQPMRSSIAWSDAESITVRGMSLTDEILGHFNLGDMAVLQITGRPPSPKESTVFNAILVTLVEHGLTPSSMAARLTYTGAPEAMQAAIAAGLCGMGTVFVGSMEGAARVLSQALPLDAPDTDLGALANRVAQDHFDRKEKIPGLGHPIHKPIDPRTPRLFEIATENDCSGRYIALMNEIEAAAERVSGKARPINATGAIGAICCELGMPWQVVRGFGVMSRAVGLVGHILEEQSNPISMEMWLRVEEETSTDMRRAQSKA